MTVPQQTINMTTIFNCADCRKAIKENSREHDDCWTNMEKDDDLWYCGDCKDAHMDEDEEDAVVCPRCDRTEKECEEQAEDKDNKNPITDWCGEWGLSCDECYYKNHPESDDDVSINTQEECCECDLTEKQYNEKKGYEENLSTLHYIGGKTYCPDCRDPENSDDEESVCDDEQRSYGARGAPAPESDAESDCSDGRDRDDDEMSECEECGERYELGDFNCVESGMKQYCYCDDCFATKIKDGEVIKNPEEEDEWIFACDD